MIYCCHNLLVGLLEDTAAHHAVHFGADKHPVCLRDHDLYGSRAGTALQVSPELEHAVTQGVSLRDRGVDILLPDKNRLRQNQKQLLLYLLIVSRDKISMSRLLVNAALAPVRVKDDLAARAPHL